jgi:hypothetical protein
MLDVRLVSLPAMRVFLLPLKYKEREIETVPDVKPKPQE